MILQALVDYYDRMAADPDSGIAPLGWFWEKIAWLIELDEEGHPIGLSSMYEQIEQVDKEGKKTSKRVAKRFLVPMGVIRTGKKKVANCLWDNVNYALGVVKTDSKGKPQESPENAQQKNLLFIKKIEELNVAALSPILTFLKATPLDALRNCAPEATEAMLKDIGAKISFRLANDITPIFEREDVHVAYDRLYNQSTGEDKIGRCLVTGEEGPLARLAPKTKRLGSSSECGLVTFQKKCGYDSYRKEQGDNAPISEVATNKYSTALQALIDSNRNRFFIGNEVLLFWASRASGESGRQLEEACADIFVPQKDNPNKGVESLRSLLSAAIAGKLPGFNQPNARFFFLGLRPGKARIAVRLWVEQTLAETAQNLQTWFDDLEIVRPFYEEKDRPISLFRLLCALVPNRKKNDAEKGEDQKASQPNNQRDDKDSLEKLPSRLSGDLLYAAFHGGPIPDNVAQAILRRLKGEDITFIRAALLKAWLTRNPLTQTERKPTVMLDRNNDNIGYCLGRLFAVLEKIQYEALGKLNASIKDKFYASASTSPNSVLGSLVTKSIHHESKLGEGRRIFFDKLKTEIFSHFSKVPAHLELADQVNFAIGYYHQRQELFPPPDKTKDTSEEPQE